MRVLYVVLIMLSVTACSSGCDNTEMRVADFYVYYLNRFANSQGGIKPDSGKMEEYVSRETLHQLDVISDIYEQEIIGSDYYTYSQDYSPDWIPLLKVGCSKDYFGGKYIDVWLGRENNQTYQIGVYLRKEDGRWKIYRVKNITERFEQYIFDTHAIERARQHAENIK